MYVRIFEPVHAPSGLGLVSGVCLLPVQNKARRDHPFTVFLSYHIRLHGVYDCHRLEIEYSLPFCFDCFRKLRLLFGRKVVPRYLVGVPSTEIKILHALCSPRPTQSKKFRVPCFLRRRSFVSPPLLSGCSSFFHLWSASIIRVGHVASSLYSPEGPSSVMLM